ncbi:MAG: hypothetical protein AAF322_06885, partial [Pseudomonadota bacterium]
MDGGYDPKREVEALLDQGQVFLAQDLAQSLAAEDAVDPEVTGLHALALIRSGATEAAEAMLAPLLREHGFDEDEHRRSFAAFHTVVARAASADAADLPAEETRALLTEARAAIAALMAGGDKRMGRGALLAVGDCCLELWRRGGDAAARERAFRLFAAAAEDGRAARPAALAALVALAAGRRADALDAASIFRRDASAPWAAEAHGGFWRAAGAGALALAERRVPEAARAFADARAAARATSHRVTLMRDLFAALAEAGVDAPEEAAAAFGPPRVVVFAGVPFDRPGAPPRCPPAVEHALRAAIRERLDALGADIGYAAGGCGPDLIFCEAMLERAGEANLVLPFRTEDFIEERVAYLDPSWRRRFEMTAKLAASVAHATPGPYLGDRALHRFGNQALHGAATMRARQYGTEAELLAVWDMAPGAEAGDVADFIDLWADMRRLHIVDLDAAAEAAGVEIAAAPALAAPAVCAPAAKGSGEAPSGRVIRALLMSDIVGSSRLGEAEMPRYARFIADLAARLADRAPPPAFANTWGDAVFAVSASAVDLAAYALALRDAVVDLGDLGGALSPPLAMRVSLNAGPVLEAPDPIAGRVGAFGSEIVRAARIEPVTTPNQIYATDAFAALLIAEESEARAKAETEGRDWASP